MEWVKLGEIATVTAGKNAPKDNEFSLEGHPFIRAGHLESLVEGMCENNLPYVDIDIANKNKYKLYDSNTIIFAKSGMSILKDRVYMLKKPSYLVNHLAALEIYDKEVNKKFIKYQLSYIRPSSLIKGESYPSISLEDIKNLKVLLTSNRNQNRIVSLLDKSEKIINLRKEQIQAYDDLIESLFFEMFGNPITNNKNFKTNKFINVVKLKRGYDLPVKSRVGNKYDVYGSNGVLDRHNDFKVDKAGIITGRSGTIGKVFRNKGMYWPLNTTLYSEKTYDNNIIFLEYLLENFKLERFATGTGVPTLNRNIVHKEEIIDVPIEMQNKFANYVLKIEEEKKKLSASLNELEILFEALMEDAFSGNLFKE